MILLGNLEEGLSPGASADQTLFIEDEEGILYVLVLLNIVPRIHSQYAMHRPVGFGTDTETYEGAFPVEVVPLPRSSDDVYVSRAF